MPSAQTSDGHIRVVLADDHPALRIGLRVLLEQAPDIAVVGEAGDGREALKQIVALEPAVAVIDCRLPALSGSEVAAELQRREIATRTLALSAYREDAYVRGMIDAGAVGYLLKEEAPDVIVAAVRAVARGEGWFSPPVASLLVQALHSGAARPPHLTQREHAVLQLVGRGGTNKHIAAALRVTERTVEFHIGNLLQKLGVSSRVELALWAKDHGVSH
jgi:DNA-binding NarL/FixJ family response regulator